MSTVSRSFVEGLHGGFRVYGADLSELSRLQASRDIAALWGCGTTVAAIEAFLRSICDVDFCWSFEAFHTRSPKRLYDPLFPRLLGWV